MARIEQGGNTKAVRPVTVLAREIRRPASYKVDLSGLMAVCETNYWRLRKLLLPAFPHLVEQHEYLISLPALDKNRERHFALRIREVCPYTTTLDFVERVSDTQDRDQVWGLSPRLTVRIYHDAKTAEVIAFQGHRRIAGYYDYPNPRMHQRDEKLQWNNLLAEWLNHCLHYGYRIDDNSASLNSI